jgi:hypothetical protein
MAEYPTPTIVPTFNEVNYPTTGTTSTSFTNVTFNSVNVQGSSWDSYATSHTITSSDLKYLGINSSIGELTVYAKSSAGKIGLFKVVVSRSSTGTVAKADSTKVFDFTTFTITASGSTLVIATDTASKISWLYIGV